MLHAPPSPDPKVTVEFLDRQLARGNLYVQFKLGRMLARGAIFPVNARLGFLMTRAASERGYGPASLMLAMDFYSGKHGLPKRMDLWAFYWRKWRSGGPVPRVLRSEPAEVIPFRGGRPAAGCRAVWP